jgi:ribosome maturation factor RimP
MRTKKEQALLEALEGAAAQHGLELVDVELSGSGAARIVRVYLDDPSAVQGPDIDVLVAANVWVEAIVEATDTSKGRYTLEVSSPGIDRPLRTLAHFMRFASRGEIVQIKTVPVEGRGNWTGELVAVEEADGQTFIVIDIEGMRHRIPFEQIQKARIKGKIDFKGNDDRRDQDVI